jgi:hypothetical protein
MGGPGTHLCEAIYHLQGSFWTNRRDSATLLSSFLPVGDQGASGLCKETSSPPIPRIRRFKSTDAFWRHRTSGPKMNLSVILAIYTQAVRGADPESVFIMLPSSWGGSLLMPFARWASGRLPLSLSDVRPGDRYCSASVNAHETGFISYLSLGAEMTMTARIYYTECETRGRSDGATASFFSDLGPSSILLDPSPINTVLRALQPCADKMVVPSHLRHFFTVVLVRFTSVSNLASDIVLPLPFVGAVTP